MYELERKFLADSSRHIMERSGVSTRLTMEFASLESDCALLEFGAGQMTAAIARRYQTEERFLMYIIQYYQGVMPFLLRLVHAFPDLCGRTFLWLDDIARGPGLGFIEGVHPDQFAVPDPMFVRSQGYNDIRSLYPRTWTAWKDRSPTIFWRGATTGHRSQGRPGWQALPRVRLCRAAAEARDPSLFDIGINKIVQIGYPNEVEEIRNSGYMRETVPQDAYLRYRHSIDIDGNSNSWPGLFNKLLMQNTVFKVQSEAGYRQWYYHDLHPWVHFVPVDSAMAELEERAAWVLLHPEKAFYIADNAFAFSRALTVEAAIAEVGPRLRTYLARSDRESP
jgi:hypothetical protein